MKRRRVVKLHKLIEQDVNKIDKARVKLDTKTEEIIREQERIIEAATDGRKMLNKDIRSLKFRLKPYVGKRPKDVDSVYYELKERYENKLFERAALERAIIMAEESITAAQLHRIPGE